MILKIKNILKICLTYTFSFYVDKKFSSNVNLSKFLSNCIHILVMHTLVIAEFLYTL